jgi:hypothetical protein
LASVVFFLLLVTLGNSLEALDIKPAWLTVLFCLGSGWATAISIHADCASSCMAFSVGWLCYTYAYAQETYHTVGPAG